MARADNTTGENVGAMTYKQWYEWKTEHSAKRVANDNYEFTNIQNRVIIGLNRNAQNTGVYAALPEKMSKKHIREVATEYGIDMRGLKINIIKNEEYLLESFMYAGAADYLHVGKIDFFPKAFWSKEELLRTLYHGREHVKQYRKYGAEYVMNHSAFFEGLAKEAENKFIAALKEAGKL